MLDERLPSACPTGARRLRLNAEADAPPFHHDGLTSLGGIQELCEPLPGLGGRVALHRVYIVHQVSCDAAVGRRARGYARNCSHTSTHAWVVSASDSTSMRSSLPWNRPDIASAVSVRENRPKP